MEQTQLQEKLKVENEILVLKREHKNLTGIVASIKKEYAAIAELKETAEKQVAEQKEYLNTVINDIASAKLDWAQERSTEMDKLAQKNAEAENVLKRKAELNIQEEAIRQLEASNIDVLNETRRLELKVSNDKIQLEVKEREIEEKKKAIALEHENNLKEVAGFKANALKVLKLAEKL